MSKAYTDFYDYVMPDVPGCLTDVAQQAIRLAVIDFCKRTNFWRYRDHAAIDVVADTADYALTAPANTDIQKVLQATYSRYPTVLGAGYSLVEKGVDELHFIYPNGWQTEEADEPLYCTQLTRASIILVPLPQVSVTGGLQKLTLSLKPTLASTNFSNEEIFDHYAEQIAAGALYRLQKSPKKPYTDLDAAKFNKGIFDRCCLTVADQVRRSFMNINIGVGAPLI